MSEILDLAGIIRDGGWIVLFALFVVSVGLLVLDHRWKAPAAEDSTESRESRAA